MMGGGESDIPATERTPLLPSSAAHTAPQAQSDVTATGAFHTTLDDAASGKSIGSEYPRKKRPWSIIIVLVLSCLACVGILFIGFLVPAAAQRYANDAVTVNVSSISVESFTSRGLQARVKANIHVDASKVQNGFLRSFGRLATAVIGKLSTEEGELHVFLPDYHKTWLGNASIPPMVVDVRNGHSSSYDFVSDAQPVSLEGAQKLAEDYINGRLHSLRVMGTTRLKVKYGIIPLGNHLLSQMMKIEALPSIPKFHVTNLIFYGVDHIVKVNASATIPNPYPIKLNLPSLNFIISLPGCNGSPIPVSSAITPELVVRPKSDVEIAVFGTMDSLPANLTEACSGGGRSPMDNFLESYLHGNSSTVYVSGGEQRKGSEAPKWLANFLQSITATLPFPGHKFDNMVEEIGLSHVEFILPDAEPGNPEASPKISAHIDATVALPTEFDFPISVQNLKATADLLYHHEKFAEMDVKDWQPARSYPIDDGKLAVQADVNEAPLNITNYGIFRTVVERLLWGAGRGLILGIDGLTDVQMETNLGNVTIRGIPAKGDVTIKALPSIPDFAPKVSKMEVLTTTATSITFQFSLIAENPTEYCAHIPYLSLMLEKGGNILANASVTDVDISPGDNLVLVKAVYEPRGMDGTQTEEAINMGLALMGDYVSGKNATVTVRPHRNSIPGFPELGEALSGLAVSLPIPHLLPPSSHDPGGPERRPFLVGATMHIISSTASFLLHNPFPETPIRIFWVSGTAMYNGSELGTIEYDETWELLAGSLAGEGGLSVSPRMPVHMNLRGAAYKALRDALGKGLRIDAFATAEVGVGDWRGCVEFVGGGLQAAVRL